MPTTRPVPDTYTTREVARQLGMAVRSVQMMVDRGELEAWKTPGGHRRISGQSVERWRAARGLQPLAGAEAGPPPVALARAQPPGQGGAAPATPHPLRRATDRIGPPPRQVPQALAGPHTALSGVAAAPGPSVLLIEDSVHFQNLMALLLRQHFPGLPFYVASDGIAGLAMAGQLQPQVLVVDILLPGIDGSALITGLRSHAQFEGTQLIVVTSLDEHQRVPYAHALSGIAVVHKPRLAVDLPPLLGQMLATGHSGTTLHTQPSHTASSLTVAR